MIGTLMIKNRIILIITLWTSFYTASNLCNVIPQNTYHLSSVFNNQINRATFSPFADNVLRQYTGEQLLAVTNTIQNDTHPKTDKEFYTELLKKIPNITAKPNFHHQLKLVSFQKKLLAEQALSLLDDKKINGCVEIGTPATYSSTILAKKIFSGKRYVINDKQRFTDRFQASSCNPFTNFLKYDQFIPLNNYQAITQTAIPDNSVDLVICFIGLHHVPIATLDTFIASIKRILRPGGTFLLRDHDAHTPELVSITYAAHSVYNATIPQESVDAEMSEYRNFQPLQFWINKLEAHNFKTDEKRIQQEGDPSLNTMIKFTKQATTEDEIIMQASHEEKKAGNYERPLIRSYLSSPEWTNVDISHEYGKFIHHTPWYDFPYMKSVGAYWKVFFNSWIICARKKGYFSAITAPDNFMNLFIGVSLTIEYGIKAAIALPVRLLFSGSEESRIKALVDDPNNELPGAFQEIKICKTYPNSAIKLIEMPRYTDFLKTVLKLKDTKITFKEIARQKEIQCKVRRLKSIGADCLNKEGCTKEFDWTIPTQTDYIYSSLTLTIPSLMSTIKKLQEDKIEILHLHDF